ncbi:hypothetical protein, partial [Flavobacterium sp.]|uniref:hypothetical protein n=1 Tax=Flavobacterium sp. TaxID=239 RepID=UPI0039E59DD7
MFGGFSFNDSLTNIIVFNENITVEDPDKMQHVSQVKYLVECILNGNEFTIKSDGDVLTFEEFIYLSETNVENIEKLKHLININSISSIKTIYKVNDQYFIFYDFSTVESLELNEVILSPEDKNPKKIIKTKPVLLNEKLKENKQTIIFFISSNGALIENAFKEIDQIRKNELVFFIEDKAESNIFGSVVRIASGSGFTSIQNIPFKEISKVVNVYEKSIRSVDFEFMLKDHFNDKSGTLYLVKRVFFGLLSEVIIIKDNLPLTVVEVFAETLAGLLSKLQFNETTWKYYDDEGNVAKNNAILLPVELLETKNLKKENIQVYTKKLNEIEQLLKQSLQANRALIKDNKIFKKIITKIYDVIDSINDFISSSFGKGMEITKNFLIFYNAYIIGLINGFLKAVEDFFVLIAQLAKAIKFVQSETKKGNASNYWVMFFESIENFYDLLSNLITVKNLVALGSFLKKCLLLSPLVTYMAIHYFLENDFSITSDRLGYYIGYAIGIIIELIVETILTGGATTVEQAVKLVFNQLKMIVQKLSKKVISFSDNIIEGIITVYAKLKHLFKNFPQFLDDLFELILNWVRKLEDFMAIFSKETLALFSKHGVDICKVPQSALYSGIPIPVGDNVYALMRDGKEIFRGSKAEVNDFANHLKKMTDAEAKKFLDDITKGNKLKLAEKM